MEEDFDDWTINELGSLDKQLCLDEIINAFMHCQRRYERQFIAVCVVSLNYGECDAAVKKKVTWDITIGNVLHIDQCFYMSLRSSPVDQQFDR